MDRIQSAAGKMRAFTTDTRASEYLACHGVSKNDKLPCNGRRGRNGLEGNI